MTPTIYASFTDGQGARHAIAALIRGGIPADTITFACKTNGRQVQAADLNPAQDNPAASYQDPVDTSQSRVEVEEEVGGMAGTFPDLRASGPGNPGEGVGLGTRYAGIAATAHASANPGTMTEFLWNSLSEDMARYYQQEYDGGRAIVIVRDPPQTAETILREQGAIQVQRQSYLA